jgi:hypothetical protein
LGIPVVQVTMVDAVVVVVGGAEMVNARLPTGRRIARTGEVQRPMMKTNELLKRT